MAKAEEVDLQGHAARSGVLDRLAAALPDEGPHEFEVGALRARLFPPTDINIDHTLLPVLGQHVAGDRGGDAAALAISLRQTMTGSLAPRSHKSALPSPTTSVSTR